MKGAGERASDYVGHVELFKDLRHLQENLEGLVRTDQDQ
jgi:hypothetical protein